MWNMADIAIVIYVCIIMHNMIMEDERGNDLEICTPQVASSSFAGPWRGFSFANLTQEIALIEDTNTYYNMHNDLVQHLWPNACGCGLLVEALFMQCYCNGNACLCL